MSVEQTEPLANGAELPDHPAHTTALKVTEFLTVRDVKDGQTLRRGMHENELRCLMLGHNAALGHLYLYQIRDQRIFHTRPNPVVIDCVCESV